MLCDEVMSGFGRTGEWFAVNHWNVIPDIITMAKGLTSGYAPLGAVAMKEDIAKFFDHRVYEGGLTYNGHPISLAAGIANIEVIKEEKILDHVKKMGPILRRQLLDLGEKHPIVGDIRSIGLFGILELVRDQKTKEPMAIFNSTSSEMSILQGYLKDNGVYLYTHWNAVLIIPPLIIKEEELAEGMGILDRALDHIEMLIDEK